MDPGWLRFRDVGVKPPPSVGGFRAANHSASFAMAIFRRDMLQLRAGAIDHDIAGDNESPCFSQKAICARMCSIFGVPPAFASGSEDKTFGCNEVEGRAMPAE